MRREEKESAIQTGRMLLPSCLPPSSQLHIPDCITCLKPPPTPTPNPSVGLIISFIKRADRQAEKHRQTPVTLWAGGMLVHSSLPLSLSLFRRSS